MNKITPHIWFDKEAKEAAEFYTSLFPNSKITNCTTIYDTPSGECDLVSFELSSQSFMAISAGPFFKLNPSISLLVNFNLADGIDVKEKIDMLWNKLLNKGTVLMPIQEYSFSKYYGWIQDKYGLSWQLLLSDIRSEERPHIIPSLMFVGSVFGKAEEAINFYMSIFKNSKWGNVYHYGPDQSPEKEGAIAFADFILSGKWFSVTESAQNHDFSFNESISFMVNCESQSEIDYYWEKLSAVPEAEQCGWLKDKYGISWQIVPTVMREMMKNGTREQIDGITQAFLKMKKFDIATLKRAYEKN